MTSVIETQRVPLSHPLEPTKRYHGDRGRATWEGNCVEDDDKFRGYLADPVGPRIRDEDDVGGLREVLQGLATTDMETRFVAEVLGAVPPIAPWEVGEALAECLLQDDPVDDVVWPWNLVRDRRTPRASLPGADLVGLARVDRGGLLVFGEVKTSSDRSTPPNVMYGERGMTWQLEQEATRLDIQHALLAWLSRRCTTPDTRELFRSALEKYIASQGTAILLVGVLLRDTEPSERDVKARACHLEGVCQGDARVRLMAWYLPLPIPDWPTVIGERAA